MLKCFSPVLLRFELFLRIAVAPDMQTTESLLISSSSKGLGFFHSSMSAMFPSFLHHATRNTRRTHTKTHAGTGTEAETETETETRIETTTSCEFNASTAVARTRSMCLRRLSSSCQTALIALHFDARQRAVSDPLPHQHPATSHPILPSVPAQMHQRRHFAADQNILSFALSSPKLLSVLILTYAQLGKEKDRELHGVQRETGVSE